MMRKLTIHNNNYVTLDKLILSGHEADFIMGEQRFNQDNKFSVNLSTCGGLCVIYGRNGIDRYYRIVFSYNDYGDIDLYLDTTDIRITNGKIFDIAQGERFNES